MTMEEWTEVVVLLREAAARLGRLEGIVEGREVPLPTVEERLAMLETRSAPR